MDKLRAMKQWHHRLTTGIAVGILLTGQGCMSIMSFNDARPGHPPKIMGGVRGWAGFFVPSYRENSMAMGPLMAVVFLPDLPLSCVVDIFALPYTVPVNVRAAQKRAEERKRREEEWQRQTAERERTPKEDRKRTAPALPPAP